MRYSPLLFLFFVSTFCIGQKFSVDASQFEINSNISFTVDTVFDARSHKETMGYIFDKKSKSYITVFPASGLASSLQSVLKSNSNNNDESLTLRLNRLFVYHTTIQGKRHLSAEASITFIAKNNQGYLEQFTSTKTLREEARFGNNLAHLLLQEAVDSCLLHFEKRKKSGVLSNILLSKKDVATQFTESQVTVKKMPYHIRGLFHTFYDLRDYSIDTRTHFEVVFTKNDHNEPRKAKLKFDDKSMRKKEIYAFSNGDNLFLKTGKYYTELTDSSGKFWLNQYPEFSNNGEYQAGMVASGAVGGLIGIGLYVIIAKKPAYDNTFILDFERGAVVPADYPSPGTVTSQILFYGSSFLSNTDSITLSIKDNDPITLGRDEYYVYESDDKCMPVEVYAQWGESKFYKTITPKILKTTITRCEIRGDKVGMEILDMGRENSIEANIKSDRATQVFD